MKIHHFFGNFNFDKKIVKIFDADILNQIKNVLRLKKGEKIYLNNHKEEAIGEIKKITKKDIEIGIMEKKKVKSKISKKIILYCSIIKKDNFEWIAQKATEIGVSKITPIISERTVKQNLNKERLEKIIKEAGEQSERNDLPELSKIITFEEAIKNSQENDLNLFCDIKGERIYKSFDKGYRQIGIFIGPEGGWTGNELKMARENGFSIVRLGDTNLRAETAAILAVYMVISLA